MERDLEFYPTRKAAAHELIKKQEASLTYRHVDMPWKFTNETVVPLPDDSVPVEEEGLEAADVILIVFICFAVLVFFIVIAVILRALFCHVTTISDYNELY